MRPSRTGAVVALIVVACSYKDVGEPEVQRTYTVAAVSASPFELVLAPADCPTESVRVAASTNAPQRRRAADVACLAKLEVGASITYARQREKQGCMPGKVYYDVLGGCDLGPLEMASSGTPCAKPATK